MAATVRAGARVLSNGSPLPTLEVRSAAKRIAKDLGVKVDESVPSLVAGIKRPDDSIKTHLNALERAVRGVASAAKTQKALQRP